MAMQELPWAADVPISMPQPMAGLTSDDVQFPMYGFVFTRSGLAHDLNSTVVERLTTPTYRPIHDPSAEVVYGNDVDAAV